MAILPINAWTQPVVTAIGNTLPLGPYRVPAAGSQDFVWVEILSSNLVSQGPVQFVTLTATLYYNAVGTWSVTVPYTDALWNIMMAGDFVVNVNWRGLFSFGGKCEKPEYQDSIPGSAGGGGPYLGPFIILSGADYLALIANRIAYPSPGSAWNAQTAAGNDTVTSINLESAIKHYVSVNVGSGAISSRRHSLLDIAMNLNRGSNVTYSVSFGTGVDLNLLDVVRALIAQAGSAMGVSITRNPTTHRLLFDVYIPRDLSGKAWFSKSLGNLTAIDLSLTDPTCTDALVQGASSFVAIEATSVTQWNKAEQFIDSSSETVAANLTTTAQLAVASGGYGPSMAATMTDTPFLTYGRDYYLGDIVSVEARPGAVYSDVVTSVTLTADMSQTPAISVIPTIGNSANATATDTSIIGQLTARIRALEKKLATK